nr:sigma-70 family RNA polymerase sigma factor [Alteromonas sp. 5E99-2]
MIDENKQELLWGCQKILHCPKRAEDVLQDAFIRLSQLDLKKVLNIKKPEGYLFQVVKNISIDYKRKLNKESLFVSDASMYTEVPDTANSPEEALDKQSSLNAINDSLAKLPVRTREVFELYRYGEFSQKNIALKYDISPTLVNFLIKAAVDTCRKDLQK